MDFINNYWKSFTSFFLLSCLLIIIIIFSFAYSSVCRLLTHRYAVFLLISSCLLTHRYAFCLLISSCLSILFIYKVSD